MTPLELMACMIHISVPTALHAVEHSKRLASIPLELVPMEYVLLRTPINNLRGVVMFLVFSSFQDVLMSFSPLICVPEMKSKALDPLYTV